MVLSEEFGPAVKEVPAPCVRVVVASVEAKFSRGRREGTT